MKPRVRSSLSLLGPLLLAFSLAGFAKDEPDRIEEGYGPQPRLPAPERALVPTVHIAPARGWPAQGAPRPASGLKVTRFAEGLDHPRWIYVLPNGDVLVAETNAPPRPEDGKGLKGLAMKQVMKNAGAAVPSANRITLLRDANGDGTAELKETFLEKLNSPFGMALVGKTFYVANTDALMRFPYLEGQTRVGVGGSKLSDLPGGALNHHWTKSLLASPDGKKLYVGVGSNSNIAESGLAAEQQRAAILEIDAKTGERRVYAHGLRNPVGLAWEPQTKALWTVVNERDELGDDLVPDYLTSVLRDAFYGWPWSYYGQHVDERVKPPNPDKVSLARVPDYALGAHTASLGLAWSGGNRLPAQYASGMFIGQHGSWNRKPRSGYKVIFVPFANGKPQGRPVDVLTGFLDGKGDAMGRPVGVVVARDGSLLVADDVGNVIWRVSARRHAEHQGG